MTAESSLAVSLFAHLRAMAIPRAVLGNVRQGDATAPAADLDDGRVAAHHVGAGLDDRARDRLADASASTHLDLVADRVLGVEALAHSRHLGCAQLAWPAA